jgi:hypothetical protein
MFATAGDKTNRNIRTWYPESARIVDCELEVNVVIQKPALGENYPNVPVTLDFYFTQERTAEEYLGSVEGVTGAGKVTLPVVPAKSGYIRLQTQGAPPPTTNPGQPESSQYSRVAAFTTQKCVADVDIKTQAWAEVPAGADSYNEIITGKLLPSGTNLAKESNVWMTYTVTNTGTYPLRKLVVKDTHDGEICEVEILRATQKAYCFKKKLIPKLGVKYV